MGNKFLIRWAAAAVLVFTTYNPTSLNYLNWAINGWEGNLPLVVLIGALLALGYIIFFRATLRSIGRTGIILLILLVCAFLWVLYDWGVISLDNPSFMAWIALIALSFIMGVGLSWSIIRRRLSGQVDVDDVEE